MRNTNTSTATYNPGDRVIIRGLDKRATLVEIIPSVGAFYQGLTCWYVRFDDGATGGGWTAHDFA